MKTLWWKGSLAAAAVIGVIGCGGGGGGGGASTPPATSDEGTQVTGVAVDDLILNGVVRVADENNATLATGRTDSQDGSYTLRVDHHGVVVVHVTCDDASEMYNPETNQTSACPDNLLLRSVATVEGADAPVEVNVSPLTEVTYRQALANDTDGTLDAEDVEEAIAQVAALFGVNPVAENPVENETYSGIVSAVHTVADNRSITVMEVAEMLAEAMEDGAIEPDEEGISEIAAAMEDENVSNPIVEAVDNNESLDVPDNIGSLDDLAEAKAFFEELRTQAGTIETFVDNEAVALDEAVNSTVMNIDFVGFILGKFSDTIAEMYENNITEIPLHYVSDTRQVGMTKTGPGAFTYRIVENDNEWRGNITFPEVILGDEAEEALYGGDTLSIRFEGDLPLDKTPAPAGVDDNQTFVGNVTLRTNTTGGASLTMTGTLSSNGDTIELTEANADFGYVFDVEDNETVFNYVKLNQVAMQGTIGGYALSGTLTVNTYAQNEGLKDEGGFSVTEHGGMIGELVCEDSTQITVRDIYVVYDGMRFDPVDMQPDGDSAVYVQFEVPFNLEYDEWLEAVEWNATCAGDDNISFYNYGSWGYSEEELANSGWLPADVTFEGSVANGAKSMEGMLHMVWLNVTDINLSAEDDPEVNATFNGKLRMSENSPELNVNLFGSTMTKSGSMDYTYDTTTVNLNVTYDEDSDTTTFEATNQLGHRFVLIEANGQYEGNLTKNGRLLGEVEERNGAPVIKYYDNSFESLF
jgi:hypothetical protein